MSNRIVRSVTALTVLALLLLCLGYFFNSHLDNKSIQDKIERYIARIEKYPSESENYKMLSDLYESINEGELADRYYELYQRVKQKKENKNDDFLQKQLELIRISKRKNTLLNGRVKDKKEKRNTGSRENNSKNKSEVKVQRGDDKLSQAMALFEEGHRHYLDENYTKAKEKFVEAIDVSNDFAKAHAYFASSVFVRNKNIAKAKKHAEKSLYLDENEDKGYEVLGDINKEVEDYSEAKKNYLKAIKANGENYLAYYKLANIKYLENYFDDAILFYQKSLKIKPSFHKPYLNLSVSLLHQKSLRKAKKYLVDSLSISKLHRDQVRIHKTYSTLAYIYYLEKNYRQSLIYYKKSTSLNPTYKDFYHMGLIYENRNQLSLAKDAYRKSIANNKKYDKAKFNLGTIYLNEKKYDKALMLFEQVSKINPKLAVNYVNAGKCYLELGQDDNAYLQFQKALKYNENLPTALIEMAKYWKKNNIKDKAIEYAQTALEKESIKVDKIIYLNELGLIYKRFSMPQEAEDAFEEAISINAEDVPTLHNLASLYQSLNSYSKAISIYENIANIDEENADAYFALGKLFIKLGKTDLAVTKLQHLKVHFPTFTKIQEVNDLLKKL